MGSLTNITSTNIVCLKGVGAKLAESLHQIHIDTVLDLLFHLPLRYENRTRITPLNTIRVGDRVVIEGTIIQGYIPQRGQLLCRLCDNTGEIYIRFFHFTAQQRQQFTTPGIMVRCFGEVRHRYQGGGFEMIHPQYGAEGLMSDHLMPVYACGKDRIRQTTLRKLIDQALVLCKTESVNQEDPLAILWPYSENLYDALCYVHHPPADADITALLAGTHAAQQRLAFEELVAHQLALIQSRQHFQRHPAIVLIGKSLQAKLMEHLGFILTTAQQRVLQEINTDLSRDQPMLRLLQGDVGSGKTIIAALAALQAVEEKKQAALMVPTELLAEQHAQNLQKWFEPLGVRVACLTGSLNQKTRKWILEALKAHTLDIIIGTHALFQEEVEFADLALIIIDEQHRFGVAQRLALKQKRKQHTYQPHQLMMTATPIPRTLAMSAYADLDISIIDELPPGRQPITTLLLSNQKRAAVMERIVAHCHSGQQVYWVCTLIEVSEALSAEAAEERYKSMLMALPDLKIGLIHGRLKADMKEQIMAAFKAGEIDLLIATTVIEVGVDVPNASLMIIENAERLGLAQLHQLRGRVGRGKQASFCVLLYQGPLSLIAKKRLQVMRDHQDGFYIAEQDLAMRGPGEILGTRQTGLLQLKIADIVRDQHLLPAVKTVSQQIIAQYAAMIPQLMARWLPRGEQYIEV